MAPGKPQELQSFYVDNGSYAAEEVSRITKKEYVKKFANWSQVVETWPDARVSKVGLILKEKADGPMKSRFVIDLLRSGENGEADITERTCSRACTTSQRGSWIYWSTIRQKRTLPAFPS